LRAFVSAVFDRLLELNVMAPELGDIKLLEDTHAWGQVRAIGRK